MHTESKQATRAFAWCSKSFSNVQLQVDGWKVVCMYAVPQCSLPNRTGSSTTRLAQQLELPAWETNVIDLEVGQTRKSDTPARYFRDKSIF
jgi:hypothetical protein